MEKEVLKSWNENAEEWVKIIASKKIPSRMFTNKAILDILKELPVYKILDCGCGEGWLTRNMTEIGKKSVGIDATKELVNHAKNNGPESFYQISFEEVSAGKKIPENPFDAAVFNFCLYQKKGIHKLLKKVKKSIAKNGFVIIQTMHPFFLLHLGLPYESQWIMDSWKGLPGNFKNGHSWYARTTQDWISIFIKSELKLNKLIEVTNNEQVPISVIFVLK